MELQRERFAISFDPRHRLLQVSLVVECGLGFGHARRAESAFGTTRPTTERQASPRHEGAVRASRRLRRARAARHGY